MNYLASAELAVGGSAAEWAVIGFSVRLLPIDVTHWSSGLQSGGDGATCNFLLKVNKCINKS